MGFDMQTDQLISARRPDLMIINKKKRKKKKKRKRKERISKIVDFAVLADHRIKLKGLEKKDKFLEPCKGIEKTMEPVGDNYTNCNWCFWYSNKRIIKGTGGLRRWRTSGDHPNYSIIENGQNTKKSHMET